MSRSTSFRFFLCAAAVAVLVCGCSDEDPVVPDPPELTPWPDTPEKLMDWIVSAYGEMDITAYEDALHDDFEFVNSDDEVWVRQQDIQSVTSLFAGDQGATEIGEAVAGVQFIQVNNFTQIGVWETQAPTAPRFPNAERGSFDVQIVFHLEGGQHTLTITSEQLFYVIEEDVEQDDGTTRSRYFLIGQQDEEPRSRSNESISWSGLKAVYSRSPE